jgi:hypothetical protein
MLTPLFPSSTTTFGISTNPDWTMLTLSKTKSMNCSLIGHSLTDGIE